MSSLTSVDNHLHSRACAPSTQQFQLFSSVVLFIYFLAARNQVLTWRFSRLIELWLPGCNFCCGSSVLLQVVARVLYIVRGCYTAGRVLIYIFFHTSLTCGCQGIAKVLQCDLYGGCLDIVTQMVAKVLLGGFQGGMVCCQGIVMYFGFYRWLLGQSFSMYFSSPN